MMSWTVPSLVVDSPAGISSPRYVCRSNPTIHLNSLISHLISAAYSTQAGLLFLRYMGICSHRVMDTKACNIDHQDLPLTQARKTLARDHGFFVDLHNYSPTAPPAMLLLVGDDICGGTNRTTLIFTFSSIFMSVPSTFRLCSIYLFVFRSSSTTCPAVSSTVV